MIIQDEKLYSSLKLWDLSANIPFFIEVSSNKRRIPSYCDKSFESILLSEFISYKTSKVLYLFSKWVIELFFCVKNFMGF